MKNFVLPKQNSGYAMRINSTVWFYNSSTKLLKWEIRGGGLYNQAWTPVSGCGQQHCKTWKIPLVISRSELRVRDWSNARHVNATSCSQGTWCKPRDMMHLRRFFGPTTVLGNTYSMLLRHGWRQKYVAFTSWYNKKYWLLASINMAIGQHCTTSGHYFSMLPSAPVNICILLNHKMLVLYAVASTLRVFRTPDVGESHKTLTTLTRWPNNGRATTL